ncbi:DNA damage-inducible protein DinB, partial [Durusdinium trenchii]
EQLDYRYAEGKWNLRELMIHVIDAERVFSYRALRFGRGDTTPLAGFDQDDYGANVYGTSRGMDSILEEYQAVRLSTIKLYENFDEKALAVVGMASDAPVTTKAIGYITLGHNLHHRLGIEENYLKG